MPNPPSQPGVYVHELPTNPPGIEGVATSTAAFIGGACRGPLDQPELITSYREFERTFGGVGRRGPLAQALWLFFMNGGRRAQVVRVARRSGEDAARAATIELGGGTRLEAASVGAWGNRLAVSVTHVEGDDPSGFDLRVAVEPADAAGATGLVEQFEGVSLDPASRRFVVGVLEQYSQLVRVATLGSERPPATTGMPCRAPPGSGSDGAAIGAAEVSDEANRAAKTGLYALREMHEFSLLCIPPFTADTLGNGLATWAAASQLCQERRAILLVDAPADWTVADAERGIGAYAALARENAAMYFPWLQVPDIQQPGRFTSVAPGGAVAGVIALSDMTSAVWSAPAGAGARVNGASGLVLAGGGARVDESDIRRLNPLGLNCLRLRPDGAAVVWGARTLAGADTLGSEWKYLPVRRLALYIEASLARGTAWAVFEPNGEPLWARLRHSVGDFMQELFRQGALQGASPKEAYFVRCDASTTTQADIETGVVNLVVGFAPVKPAEFVVLRVQQAAAVPGA